MRTLEEIKEEAAKTNKERRDNIIKSSIPKFNSLDIGEVTAELIDLTKVENPYIKWEGYTVFYTIKSGEFQVQRNCKICGKSRGCANCRHYIFTSSKLVSHIKNIEELPDYTCVPCTQKQRGEALTFSFWEKLFGKKQVNYPIPHIE